MRPKFGISAKFVGLVVLSFIGVISVAALTLNTLRDNLMADRKAKTQEMVDVAYTLVAYYAELAQTGALTEAQARQSAAEAVGKLRYGEDGYFFITDPQPRLVMHPLRKDLLDKDLSGFTDARGRHVYTDLVRVAQAGGGFYTYWFSKPGAAATESFPKVAYAREYTPWAWVICTGVYVDDIDHIFGSQAQRVGLAIGGLTVVLVLLSALLARSVIRPIHAIIAVMRHLASGDVNIVVPGVDRHDEIGAMAAAVTIFKAGMTETERLRANQMLEHERASAEKQAALNGMADKVEAETATALQEVTARTAAMTATMEEMTASANRTGASARSATTASAQALMNAQTVASAAEQLSASIREIASQVAQSTSVVNRAVEAGGTTRAKIGMLNEEVARIGAVSNMIGEIAAKTNLLALNATIEAARAGEAGKGFAVVASEVKALATQTARSTATIAQHIAQVQAATDASVEAVARIEHTIGEMNAIAGSIAAAIEQQGAATAEIARNVSETAAAAEEMTTRTGEVTTEAEQTGTQAAEVRDNAKALNDAVGALRHSVIRVVRTSTNEVDRRHSVRYRTNLPSHLLRPGQADCAVRVADISEGGASVRGGPPLERGSRGTLRLDDTGLSLPFVVRGRDGDIMGLSFELDDATSASLKALLTRLTESRAA